MKTERHTSRWHRRRERRREGARRMVAAGAVVAFVACVVAQVAVSLTLDGDHAVLARIVFTVPFLTFLAWWLLAPGLRLDREEVAPAPPVVASVEARVERIEAAFDPVAIPRPRRRPAEVGDEAVRATVRRPAAAAANESAQYRVRRSSGEPADLPRATAVTDA